jgi:ligand-binding sensor domain-containing protein
LGREYLYAATSGGITRYNLYSNEWDFPWTISDGLPDNFIISIAYDENTDYVWCSTQLGISVYRSNWKKWENLFKNEFGLSRSDDIVSFGFDGRFVWLESEKGDYFCAENQQTSFSKQTGNFIPYEDIRWFGERAMNSKQLPQLFMNEGYFFDTRGVIKDFRLDDYDVTSHTEDPWNTIWIGSWGLSIGKADNRIKILEMLPYGLFLNNVQAFELDEYGNFWIGGIGAFNGQSGITYWDMERDKFTYYQARFNSNIYSDQVTSIALDEKYIWFGTQYGLLRFNRSENEWKTFDSAWGLRDNYILDIEVDQNYVWIATLLGLCQLDKSKMFEKDFRVRSVAEKDIRNMKVFQIELKDSLIWAGTEFGLYRYNKAKKTGHFDNDPNGPQTDEVTALGIFEDKEVWCGLADGVEVFDLSTEKWLGVPEKRFYTATPINYIVVDSSAAWLATDKGVQKYDKKRKLWRTFNVLDGLANNVVNFIALNRDYIWFGTADGLTSFLWNTPYRID